MKRPVRVLTRLAVAAALTFGAVAVAAAPAQAHPTVSGPHCDAGAGHYTCIIGVTGSVGTVRIAWYVNGRHQPAADNRNWISGNCGIGSSFGLKVRVTDASNVPVEKSRSVQCPTHIP
jgi:hypothetical protein